MRFRIDFLVDFLYWLCVGFWGSEMVWSHISKNNQSRWRIYIAKWFFFDGGKTWSFATWYSIHIVGKTLTQFQYFQFVGLLTQGAIILMLKMSWKSLYNFEFCHTSNSYQGKSWICYTNPILTVIRIGFV